MGAYSRGALIKLISLSGGTYSRGALIRERRLKGAGHLFESLWYEYIKYERKYEATEKSFELEDFSNYRSLNYTSSTETYLGKERGQRIILVWEKLSNQPKN